MPTLRACLCAPPPTGEGLVQAFAGMTFEGASRPCAFESRRHLLKILDEKAEVRDMAMLDIRPAVLKYHVGLVPVFPLQKTEVAVCTNTLARLRYAHSTASSGGVNHIYISVHLLVFK